MRPLITAEEAVRLLGLPSRSSLYALVARGSVPAVRLGPKVLRFAPDQLDELVRTGGVEGAGTARTEKTASESAPRHARRSPRRESKSSAALIEEIRAKGTNAKKSR